MNFKRYHVSKNLFDENNMNIGYWITSNGTVSSATYGAITNKLPLNDFDLTVYFYGTIPYSCSICWFRGSSLISRSHVPYNVIQAEELFTAPNNADSFIFQLSISSTEGDVITQEDINSFKCMLNEGTTPLPYEPYGDTWLDVPHYIMGTSTDTITTLPADIYANDTTATVGLKGNTVQNGTPTPTTPIQPQSCGERTGNLWDKGVPIYVFASDYKKYNSNNAIALKAGTYTISSDGVLPQIQAFHADLSPYADIQDVIQKDGRMYVGWDNLALLPAANAYRHTTIVIVEDCIITLCCNPAYIGTYIMLNSGSTALPYEPYGYKIPILSASTTTPVYLGEVPTTRRIKKLVLTGEESLVNVGGNAPYRLPINDIAISSSTSSIEWYCSHYQSVSTDDSWTSYDYCISRASTTAQSLQFRDVTKGDITDFKQYLAQQYANGTPVTIWYVLATPTTGIVNEPLRKIGDYADEVTGITIPTIAGANTIDVDTTLKPSEVTVNYHGWHPVADVHERENGAWD